MKSRIPLTAKILMLAGLNVLLLAAVALAYLQVQLGRDFDSFLLTTARERTLAVGRAFALDLNETSADQREQLADRYADAYGVRVVLLSNDGTVLAGKRQDVPEAVTAEVTAHPEGPEAIGRGRGRRPPPPGVPDRGDPPPFWGGGVPPMPEAPPFLVVADAPLKYWIGVRIPVRQRGDEETVPGTLMFASGSLLGNPFYFQPLPWVAVILATLAVTVVCWLPFVRGVTRSVSEMTRATTQIAEGRFDVSVQSRRRDELGTLARGIGEMASRLKTLVTGQKRFLGDAAHELRSPLARISVVSSLLERHADEVSRRHLEDLREDVEVMSRLTDDLLAFARAELATSPVTLVPTDVRQAAGRAVRLEGKDADVQIGVEPNLCVRAEPDLLFRALSNLIRNAVQHAGSFGPIRLDAASDGGDVLITVSDRGPGVAETELPRLFAPFHRPEVSRDRRTGGSGLGLAIVRSAVEACGGSVTCRNLTPQGFEVSVRLPAA